jgi:transposase InsO family protein
LASPRVDRLRADPEIPRDVDHRPTGLDQVQNPAPELRRITDRAKASGLLPSMGSIADCFDNAVIESFWSRMQVELLDRRRWKTRIELANAIFEYLEIWHNRRRRHSALGWQSPLEFETKNKIVVA